MKVIQIGNITPTDKRKWDNPQVGRVYSVKGISPCLNTMTGGGRVPLILVKKNENKKRD